MNNEMGKMEKQERINRIVQEEMSKLHKRKKLDKFWVNLTLGFSILVILIYSAILLGGHADGYFARKSLFMIIMFLIIIYFVVHSPYLRSWIVGVDDRGRKEY